MPMFPLTPYVMRRGPESATVETIDGTVLIELAGPELCGLTFAGQLARNYSADELDRLPFAHRHALLLFFSDVGFNPENPDDDDDDERQARTWAGPGNPFATPTPYDDDARVHREAHRRALARIDELIEQLNRLECRHPYPEIPLDVPALIRARDDLAAERRHADRLGKLADRYESMADECRRIK